ncbi:endopeptidase La [Mycoplasma sp. 1654_15]|uniref:endopeptidase La n=1 Tax=Mycoplasma sp. 1654_15 TaxID=2725994 RepID=UPI001449CEA0|nr:endopeptidase La [Mycoplasma sp. 1654_15]QJB71056.1 endopeptidase La [Mycoplasma sp. 1654_15]
MTTKAKKTTNQKFKFIVEENKIFFPRISDATANFPQENGLPFIHSKLISNPKTLEILESIRRESPDGTLKGTKLVIVYTTPAQPSVISSIDDILKYASLVKVVNDNVSYLVEENNKEKAVSTKLEFEVLEKVNVISLEKDTEGIHFVDAVVKPTKETISPEALEVSQITKFLNFLKDERLKVRLSLFSNKVSSDFEVQKLIDEELQTPNQILINAIIGAASDESFTFLESYNIFELNNYIDKMKLIMKYRRYRRLFRDIDKDIDTLMKSNLDKQQTEFILREKIKTIRQKLGDDQQYDNQLLQILKTDKAKAKFPKEVISTLINESRRIKGMMTTSPESNISKTYIDTIMALPWRQVSLDHLNLEDAKTALSKKHYGLNEVKDRIIEYLATLINRKQKFEKDKDSNNLSFIENNFAIDSNLFSSKKTQELNNYSNMPILTLVGPPGTGKTSIAKSIAEAIGKKFVKISLGGLRDESEIRGHRRTYVGALPGKIIQAIKKAGVSNPLILLDEIDKMSSDFKGDPASAMLEVLDPEQNKYFQDHYLEMEYDLSQVMFVATANYINDIPEALIDRVEILELSSYTFLEKIEIAKHHLLPQVISENLLDKRHFKINNKTIEFIIRHYTLESGVRQLKRVFEKLARKIIMLLLDKKIEENEDFLVDEEQVLKLLGRIKYTQEEKENTSHIGSVTGLAYTSVGGSTLQIEVTCVPGKGDIKLTGRLKDVMQESAQIALTYVRSNADKFGIDFDFDNNQIHIHVPEGAVPKDGPSAGITFATAIISALTKKRVSSKVAMTGEITLRGKVLEIGGLKEKSLGAYKKGIKTIYIPKHNEKNLVDIPEEVKKQIRFVPVEKYDQIYQELFETK